MLSDRNLLFIELLVEKIVRFFLVKPALLRVPWLEKLDLCLRFLGLWLRILDCSM